MRGEKAEHLATDSTGCERMSLNHALYGMISDMLTAILTHSSITAKRWSCFRPARHPAFGRSCAGDRRVLTALGRL